MTEQCPPESSSATRQKSCHACVKGKRGCDKRYPVCSRCAEKKIPCVYAKRAYAEAFYDLDSVELDMSWAGFTALSSSIDFINDNPSSLAPSASLDSILDTSINPLQGLTENQDMPSREIQLINNARKPSGQQQEKEEALNKFDYTPMADLCVQYEPWHVYDPNTKAHFIVQAMKGYPTTFAQDNCTPWMHKYLYKDQMPSSMQSCFTASTLYSNMTSKNKTSVFRVLCQSLNELKEQEVPNTPQEKLARTQALFLYQIIGLFDGDVTLRSNADRNMSLLQIWLDELCKIRENLTTPESLDNPNPNPNPPRSWEWWIFAESVRRTIVISYAFLGLWSLMCNNNDEVFFRAWNGLNSWTMSRPLWEAPSSFDFFQTWKPYPVIENFDLKSFLEIGSAEDVDEFSKFLLVAYIGLDETKQWFVDKGCDF